MNRVSATRSSVLSEASWVVSRWLSHGDDDPDSPLGWCDHQTEFEFGLDLILDGLDRLRLAADDR